MMPHRLSVLLTLLVAASLVAAACGDGPDEPEATVTPGGDGAITLENPTVTSTGLRYEDVEVGTGATPEPGGQVVVHYRGMLPNGAVFDSSYDRGQPAVFPLDGVIAGFAEGISTMRVGGRRILYIPTELAYEDRPPSGSGIPPGSDLIFEVELVQVR